MRVCAIEIPTDGRGHPSSVDLLGFRCLLCFEVDPHAVVAASAETIEHIARVLVGGVHHVDVSREVQVQVLGDFGANLQDALVGRVAVDHEVQDAARLDRSVRDVLELLLQIGEPDAPPATGADELEGDEAARRLACLHLAVYGALVLRGDESLKESEDVAVEVLLQVVHARFVARTSGHLASYHKRPAEFVLLEPAGELPVRTAECGREAAWQVDHHLCDILV